MKMVADLERVGDEAKKIAKSRPCAQGRDLEVPLTAHSSATTKKLNLSKDDMRTILAHVESYYALVIDRLTSDKADKPGIS